MTQRGAITREAMLLRAAAKATKTQRNRAIHDAGADARRAKAGAKAKADALARRKARDQVTSVHTASLPGAHDPRSIVCAAHSPTKLE